MSKKELKVLIEELKNVKMEEMKFSSGTGGIPDYNKELEKDIVDMDEVFQYKTPQNRNASVLMQINNYQSYIGKMNNFNNNRKDKVRLKPLLLNSYLKFFNDYNKTFYLLYNNDKFLGLIDQNLYNTQINQLLEIEGL